MGGNTIRPKKFQAPALSKRPKRNLKNVRATNRKHVALGLKASTHDRGTDKSRRTGTRLRRLTQEIYFADITQWSDGKAEKFLRSHEVLPGKKEKLHCWECDSVLEKSNKASSSSGNDVVDVLQCPRCRTKGRHALELKNASLSYTPFWSSMSRGYSPQYALWLRVLFAVSVKVPKDSILHMVQDAKHSLSEKLLDRWVNECFFVLAYMESKEQEKVQFQDEIVELDGSKVCSHKKTSQPTHLKRRRRTKSSNTIVKPPLPGRFARNQAARGDKRPMVHHGRMLYVKGHGSRKVVMVTMRPRTTQKGAPSPPEDATTVRKALQRHVDAKSCVSATDSAKALTATCRKFGLPNAPARHCIDEMSPTVELNQSDMTKQQQKTLTKASKVLKRPAALKRKQSFLIVGGDNSAESEISRVKGQMRRTNMLGRISPRNAQVQQFAVKRLLEKPGLMPLVTAFAEYRRDRKNQMGIQPGHAFQIDKDNTWLP
ncbi:unnamed protein product [Cladocopium goreaui]|uniref:Uncharacterized protein n=1 Tax=Cladocopium goreaui TaxID=2562237 RepID=A0A9P1CAK7_9DINO|nr:unnamed protein product [Cladocopium goreaui]